MLQGVAFVELQKKTIDRVLLNNCETLPWQKYVIVGLLLNKELL